MKTEILYKELFSFFNNLTLNQRYLEFDVSKSKEPILINSINGHYSIDSLITAIECLFLKGNQRFKEQLLEYFDESTILNADDKIASVINTIKQQCEKSPISEYTKSPVLESQLLLHLSPTNYKKLMTILEESSNIQNVIKKFNEAIANSIKEAPKMILNSMYSHLIKSMEKRFAIKEVHLESNVASIYEALVTNKIIESSQEDFMKFCKGEATEKNIGFKSQNALSSFFRWLEESNYIYIKKDFWQYFAETVYIFSKDNRNDISPDNIRKNYNKSYNPDVFEALKALKQK